MLLRADFLPYSSLFGGWGSGRHGGRGLSCFTGVVLKPEEILVVSAACIAVVVDFAGRTTGISFNVKYEQRAQATGLCMSSP
ncbi:hypothetical protein M433DRAFT_301815 [Acidomyces richmondensis BFW]|nr:MAG: hypothetical protein FE78DRAFT_421928 [Acidomyces sp. 'richmondensis']KYG44473.1 hypothetical protein M433DRAFT_301815 [Acidomyces richmondensis BFW]